MDSNRILVGTFNEVTVKVSDGTRCGTFIMTLAPITGSPIYLSFHMSLTSGFAVHKRSMINIPYQGENRLNDSKFLTCFMHLKIKS